MIKNRNLKSPNAKPVDADAIFAAFSSDPEVRSRCAACGKPLVGTMDELADHFRGCNGPD